MTAADIRFGDYVAYESGGEIRQVEALIVEHDVDCVHVCTWGPRIVTFALDYPVRRVLDGERIR